MKFGDLQRRGGSEPLSEERSPIKFGDLRSRTSTQTEPEKAGGSILDTAKDLFDFTPAGMVYNFITSPAPHFLGGAAAETAGNVANRLGQEFDENSWRRRALDSVSDSAQKIADTALEIGRNRVDTSDDGSVHDVFANGFMSNFLGSYGNLARMIHADKSADAMIKASESLANKKRVSTDDLGEYFTNPYGFVSDFANLGGSMIAAAPFSAALPIRALPLALRYGAGAGLFESAVEGGETRGNLLATNSLEGLALLSPPGGANKLLQIGGRAALNSAQEQYEEFAQAGIQNEALGLPSSWFPWNGAPEQYEAAEHVRWPAALLGGAGGVMQLMPETAQELGVDPYDQEQNIRGGITLTNLTVIGILRLPLTIRCGRGGVPPYGESIRRKN